MSDDPRIPQLLEQVLESGETPEDVCVECPQLLSEVRRRLRRIRSLEAQIEDLFPQSDVGAGSKPAGLRNPDGQLPQIPGYQVESILGRGGMGVVYKARHLNLYRPVAIKM